MWISWAIDELHTGLEKRYKCLLCEPLDYRQLYVGQAGIWVSQPSKL